MKITKSWLWPIVIVILGIAAYFFFTHKQKEDDLKFLRNNWSSYIHTNNTNYMYSKLGGIDEFDVPVTNETDYLLDEVVVHVSYIKAAGGVYKEENVTISNIAPHSVKVGRAPSSSRGTSVEIKTTEIISRTMHFCYPSGSGGYSDPYFCK